MRSNNDSAVTNVACKIQVTKGGTVKLTDNGTDGNLKFKTAPVSRPPLTGARDQRRSIMLVNWKRSTVLLLPVPIWSSARFDYLCFYITSKHVDNSHRFPVL